MMNLKILVSLLCLVISSLINAAPPASFSQAKKIARGVFSHHRQTLYCHCKYDKYNHINLKSCGMQAAKKQRRAQSVEWEHIVPASYFGKQLPCWQQPLCSKKNGKRYKGRHCCRKINKHFRQTEAELYNLWPADGLINQLRANYHYAAIPYGEKSYGCNFIIDSYHQRIEPGEYAKGIVARASLFMTDKYQLSLSQLERDLFVLWDQVYPPSLWERQWASRIAQLEGYDNPYFAGR